jgi:hypothetical protein
VITVGAACVGWLGLRKPEQMLHCVQGAAIVVAMDMIGSDRVPTTAIARACDGTELSTTRGRNCGVPNGQPTQGLSTIAECP